MSEVAVATTSSTAANTTVAAEEPLGTIWEGMAVPLPIHRACAQARVWTRDR